MKEVSEFKTPNEQSLVGLAIPAPDTPPINDVITTAAYNIAEAYAAGRVGYGMAWCGIHTIEIRIDRIPP